MRRSHLDAARWPFLDTSFDCAAGNVSEIAPWTLSADWAQGFNRSHGDLHRYRLATDRRGFMRQGLLGGAIASRHGVRGDIDGKTIMRILVVEDDHQLADGISRGLSKSGHAVDVVADGLSAEAALVITPYDLVILDLQLPHLNGMEVLRNYRTGGGRAPVMILTARGTVADRVSGLDTGADDYLAKPFELAELEARVRSLLRRASAAPAPLLKHGALSLDTVGRRMEIRGEGVDLSAREFALLEMLLLRAGRVVSKEGLLEKLYGAEDHAGENAVEVFVHRVRKKLEPAGVAIRTIRGLGYMIDKIPNA
jgi:two-component system OmpR family response regulator